MTRPGLQHPWLVAAVTVAVLAADQLTKRWALDRLGDGEVVELVGSLQLRLTFNTGAAFSSGSGFGPIIGLLAISIVLFLLWTSQSVGTRLGSVAVGMILGGALGNLADRAFRGDGLLGGAVVDFIDLQWWPVFNVADAGVVVGGILLVVSVGWAARSDEAVPARDAGD